MLRNRFIPARRLLASAAASLLLLGVCSVLTAGGALAGSSTVDGVTSSPPEIMMGSARSLVRDGDDVRTTTHSSILAAFSLGVTQQTTLSEVRLALRSDSVRGDSYDAGRRYDVTVAREESFTAQPEVPDGTWTAAALWLKAGRWNSGPWTSFTVRGGVVTIEPGAAQEQSVDPAPVPVPTAAPAPAPVPTAAPAPAILRRGDFEGQRQWDDSANVLPDPGGSVTSDGTRAYDGDSSARAHIPAGAGNKYARTIWGGAPDSSSAMDRGEGSDTWYGMGLYLPVGFHDAMQGYFVPMRWDNYGFANVSRTGLSMWPDGSMRLFRERAGVEDQVNLLGDRTFRLSEGEWHWLEVHQTLSQTDGSALNEVYVDGALVGSSTARNFYGEPLSYLRYGVVAVDAGRQTEPLTVWYDRATVSSGPVGPRV